ncbi:MAG: ABC transporter substrate-binding protein [Nakamurella sp.]
MRRQIAIGVVAVLGGALLLGACGSNSSDSAASSDAAGGSASSPANGSSSVAAALEKVSIMVGGLDKQIYLPAELTKDLGYFKDAGLDVDLQSEPAGVNAETAMLSGSVDAVVGFYDHNIQLQAKGKSTESIVQFSQVPGEVELTVDKATDVKSPADWKGKTVGITGAGSSTDFLSQYLAVKSGLKVSDVNRLPVKSGQTFIAAMQQGTVVSGMTTEPTITQAVSTGLAHVMIDMRTKAGTVAALGGTYPAACLYASTEWVNSHKDVAQKLANAFVRTLAYINTHTGAEITEHVPGDFYKGIGKDAYAKALDSGKGMFTSDGVMPSDGPQTVLSVLQAALPDVKSAKIDLSKTYTTEFAKNAPASSGN